MEEYYFLDEQERKEINNSAKKKKEFFIGIVFYLLWFVIVSKMNVFMSYGAAFPLYALFFIITLVWALIRKNSGSIFGFIIGTVIPLFFYVIVTERNIWALILYAVVIAVCVYKFFKVD